MTALPERRLVASHPRVVIDLVEGAPVIGHKDDERVPSQILFVQVVAQPSDLPIQVVDYGEEADNTAAGVRPLLTLRAPLRQASRPVSS